LKLQEGGLQIFKLWVKIEKPLKLQGLKLNFSIEKKKKKKKKVLSKTKLDNENFALERTFWEQKLIATDS
jgi:hypothetical protein